MRDILFRGKIKDSNTGVHEFDWAVGDLVRELSTGSTFILDLSHFDKTTTLVGVLIEVIPESVGQYTGLTDKNGVQIFEGDILKCWRSIGNNGDLRGYYGCPLPVIYSELWCQFVLEDKPNKLQFGIWQSFEEYGIIGNIFDNPKLLESLCNNG